MWEINHVGGRYATSGSGRPRSMSFIPGILVGPADGGIGVESALMGDPADYLGFRWMVIYACPLREAGPGMKTEVASDGPP